MISEIKLDDPNGYDDLRKNFSRVTLEALEVNFKVVGFLAGVGWLEIDRPGKIKGLALVFAGTPTRSHGTRNQ